jgi:hypothetical protein
MSPDEDPHSDITTFFTEYWDALEEEQDETGFK